MIGALKGTIIATAAQPVIIMVHDVGYAVFITETLRQSLTDHAEIFLYIHTHIREDAFDLFGFSSQKELTVFTSLLSVSGIGPKTALSVMDRGVEHIEKAIMTSDVDFFTTVPRLGKKNAQKIIIELASKLNRIEDLDIPGGTATKTVFDALLSMGFSRKELIPVMKHIPSDKNVEETIKEALKMLGKPI